MEKQPVTYDQMIHMFDTQQKAIFEINKSHTTAINARTISEIDRVAEKMDLMIQRQDVQNSNVAKNVESIAENNKTTERVNRIGGNLKWYAFGLLGFTYTVCWFYNTFNLEDIVLKLIHKI